MNLKLIGLQCEDWIPLTQDKHQWRSL